ncbi:hypothetical protein JYU34_000828 [Plutella xylostella]|uniref:Uncharacterized protein n=1 Tax=Plutella xylostella TaxID=51655 RepID=A0ABQ7R8L8_PLUXY|nr:hypothetical protein JYU34_000828 [Plutella xylostella]
MCLAAARLRLSAPSSAEAARAPRASSPTQKYHIDLFIFSIYRIVLTVCECAEANTACLRPLCTHRGAGEHGTVGQHIRHLCSFLLEDEDPWVWRTRQLAYE